MELINECLKEHEDEVVGQAELSNMLDKLKFEWALRLELATHRLRYWRQLAKSSTEELKPLVVAQVNESDETFKESLDRYTEIKGLSVDEFIKLESDKIGKLLKAQLTASSEDLSKKIEQLDLIKNDTEKFGFLDKVYGENEKLDTAQLEQFIEKAKQINEQLIENVAEWELMSAENRAKYVYIKNNSASTFAFADSVVDEFKKSTTTN